MRKKEFKKLIEDNKDKFACIILVDSTIRRGYEHTSICIIWKTGINKRTTVKTMRGKITDLKCEQELLKYRRWIQ